MSATLFVLLLTVGCPSDAPNPLEEAIKRLSSATHLDVVISPVAKGQLSNYSITDKALIERLAKTIDPALKASVVRGNYGSATYVGVKAFAKKGDKKPMFAFTIIGVDKVVFTLDDTKYEVTLPDKEFNRRFRTQDFDFAKESPHKP